MSHHLNSISHQLPRRSIQVDASVAEQRQALADAQGRQAQLQARLEEVEAEEAALREMAVQVSSTAVVLQRRSPGGRCKRGRRRCGRWLCRCAAGVYFSWGCRGLPQVFAHPGKGGCAAEDGCA